MSEPIERPTTFRTAYVVWMLLFVVGMSVLQPAVSVCVFYLLYGIPSFGEVMTIRMPEYSHSELWKGQVYYTVMEMGPASATGSGTLLSFDPEKSEVRPINYLFEPEKSELKSSIPAPNVGVILQGERLWVVSTGKVALVENGDVTEFTPKIALTRPCEPFLYEDQLAVIDMGTRGSPRLFLFQDKEWVDQGTILIPTTIHRTTIDGKTVLLPIPSSVTTAQAPTLDMQVIAKDGEYHLFVSDRSVLVHRVGIEFTPVSALAPANETDVVDLTTVEDWEIVCDVPQATFMRGKNSWKAGFENGEPFVVAVSMSGTNPFQAAFQTGTLLAYSKVNGLWTKSDEVATPPTMEIMLVWDETHNYFSTYQLGGQMLRIYTFDDGKIRETGATVNVPMPEYLHTASRLTRVYVWVYWPLLVLFILGASRLMQIYTTSQYQFGMTTVELASFARRGLARLVDYSLYLAAIYVVTHFSGLLSQDALQKNADRIFDTSDSGMFIPWMRMILALILLNLLVLVVLSAMQARWGLTPGKWIFGIRTVRSTLRPCGFLRAMARELLILADTLFRMTCLPGTLMIAFTSCRQRFGDLVADTIVIRKPKEKSEDEFTQ